MALFIFLIITYTVTVISWHIELPEPSRFAFDLNEDDFEDYLDSWLEIEERKWQINDRATSATGCAFRVNGDLGEPQPVYLRGSNYIIPTGTTGQIHLSVGEQIFVTCTGTKRVIQHPNVTSSTSSGFATCVSNTLVSGNDWFHGHSEFRNITCSGHSRYEAQATSETCYGNNTVIRVGFVINNFFYPLYWSCFDQNRLEVLYAWYEQNPPNAVHQTGVTRPSWLAGGFFPGVSVNTMYTQAQQKTTLASLVGTELAGKYITNSQHMARGHLAAKTDFIFATGQRATFFFINVAPQWQPFNAGNWNSLEQKLRARIGEAGYNTTVYTGTFGVTQLRDQNDQLVDIYLYRDTNNNPQIPVPLYFYKVVYEPVLQKGTAFVAINNPYYTETEVRALQFCTDHCRNNTAFNWIGWQPDRIDIGYSFCCTIEDFRRAVPHLPDFNVTGLLY